MQIIMVPDTNIFMQYQDVIDSFLNDVHPFNIDVLVLKIVLDELDKHKLSNKKAQSANIFIQNNAANEMLLIEGEIVDNGMEVILDFGDIDKLRTNDDKIIHIVSCLNHAVMLTADRNMYLKCRSQNVKCVYIDKNDYLNIKLEVLMSQTSAEPMEIFFEKPEANIFRTTLDILKPYIEHILTNNLGPGYQLRFAKEVQEADLCKLLDIVIQNFACFDGYLHTSSKKILLDIKKVLAKESDDEKKKQSLQNLLTIFKINKEL